jgi:hypothetical protein
LNYILPRGRMKILAELFSREDCHLSEEALGELKKGRCAVRIWASEEKNCPDNPFYECFKEKIQFVLINYEKVFKFRVEEHSSRRRPFALTP